MAEKKERSKFNATIVGDGAIAQGSGSVAIGSGSINVSVIGDGNIVGNRNTVRFDDIKTITDQINKRISNMDLPRDLKEDLQAELVELFELISTEKEIDESRITRRLRQFRRMSPDVFEMVIAALKTPLAGVSATVQKIAESYQKNSA